MCLQWYRQSDLDGGVPSEWYSTVNRRAFPYPTVNRRVFERPSGKAARAERWPLATLHPEFGENLGLVAGVALPGFEPGASGWVLVHCWGTRGRPGEQELAFWTNSNTQSRRRLSAEGLDADSG
jgi:hypothetical protein